ncbi:MAG: hypothetical protein QF511_02460 [Rhodospirillales bacterium]|nr:hypothetical protein [Rhodospirillales bacterium]HIJ43841.1 hypothetical protein [Rhodospirillaceae bacterium]MDP7097375.1 hypothetical protein [Rhodospirillales bacterium]MDP7214576.1 hypothetical protein [Rhodospirillales bacterium]HIJ45449.1 hypothetical protein [Rhodospirillaceae bacterium]
MKSMVYGNAVDGRNCRVGGFCRQAERRHPGLKETMVVPLEKSRLFSLDTGSPKFPSDAARPPRKLERASYPRHRVFVEAPEPVEKGGSSTL